MILLQPPAGLRSEPPGQLGIIGKDRLHPHQDGVVLFSQFEPAVAGLFAGDPLRLAGAGGDAAVEGDGGFERYPRPVELRPSQPAPVENPGSFRTRSLLDLDAFGPQTLDPTAGGRCGFAECDRRPGFNPAANTASVHGGVLPWWAQGSRVT